MILPSLVLLAALLITLPLRAQSVLIKSITFEGASQAQAELLTLSGLTPGKSLTKDDIEAAMHRLDDSGLFANIQYGVSAGTLTFTLEPNARSQMQRVQYQNFVWYTPDQLNDAIHTHLPLFTGSVPTSGELKTQIARILEAVLKQRGIEATVASRDLAGGKVEYSITSPQVIVADLQIENIRFDSDQVLTSLRQGIVGAEYLEGVTQRAVQENLSYALKELGYLDETVSAIGHADPKVDPARISVTMTGTATPGDRYRVARVTLPPLAGTIAAADLNSEHQVKAGGLPSPSLVSNTVARLAYVFIGRGFLDATSAVASTQDNVAHTVSYTFSVVPGDTYRMRTLLFAPSVNAPQQAQLLQAWKLPKDAVYDRATTTRSLLDPAVKTVCVGHSATEQLLPDKSTHELDIQLSCGSPR